MPQLGPLEIAVVLLVALLVFGPNRLPELAKQVGGALRELKRILRPGGLLLFAFHAGTDDLHVDDLWGQEVSLDFYMFTTAEMAAYLAGAGFDLEETVERDPYPDVEYPSRRSYIFARPAAS